MKQDNKDRMLIGFLKDINDNSCELTNKTYAVDFASSKKLRKQIKKSFEVFEYQKWLFKELESAIKKYDLLSEK